MANIPDSVEAWDNGSDKLLLDLLIRKAKRVDLGRTIIATGIICLVAEEFNYESGRRYNIGEILRRINHLKNRYVEFETFNTLNGVAFDVHTRRFVIGHAYFMEVELVSENPVHTRFRILGEPLSGELRKVFSGMGMGTIDLDWVHAYFNGDAAAMQAFPTYA